MNQHPLDIMSIGKAAGEFQLPLNAIRQAASDLGISEHRLNGTPYFDSDDIERIRDHIRQDQVTTSARCVH